MKRPLFSLPDHTVRSHPQNDSRHFDPFSYHGIVLIWEVVVAWPNSKAWENPWSTERNFFISRSYATGP